MQNEIMEYITWDNLKVLFWILFGSGIFFEISPIKINPISAILRWLGKKLNKDVEDKISKLETKVDTVQSDLQEHVVKSWRRDILDFAASLVTDKHKSREQYLNVISSHDKYEKYINERDLINGQVDADFDYILKCYNECLENNSFYTGK